MADLRVAAALVAGTAAAVVVPYLGWSLNDFRAPM